MRALRAVLAAVATVLIASPAADAYEIADFRGAVYRDTGETPDDYADNAGEHPYIGVVEFAFATSPSGAPVGETKELRVDIPPGLIPNPEAFPRCTDVQLSANACPAAAQVGTQQLTVWARIGIGPLALPQQASLRVPIYNMTVAPEQVARFSFNPAAPLLAAAVQGDKSPIHIVGGVRDTTDFGMFFTIRTPQDPALVSARQVFWGTPGDPRHDAQRGQNCSLSPIRGTTAVSSTSRLITTFASVPDAPVSRFDLRIAGGKRGILVATRGVCGRSRVAKLALHAHSGKTRREQHTLGAACQRRR